MQEKIILFSNFKERALSLNVSVLYVYIVALYNFVFEKNIWKIWRKQKDERKGE